MSAAEHVDQAAQRLPVAERLAAHLAAYLGRWPARGELAGAVDVVGSARRTQPEWDAVVRPVAGVLSPTAGGVISVPPAAADAVRRLLGEALAGVVRPPIGAPDAVAALRPLLGDPQLGEAIGSALGAAPAGGEEAPSCTAQHPPRVLDASGVFRWSTAPTDLPPAGEWVPVDDPRVPPWLRPFTLDSGVLIAWDDEGRYGAGVGVKVHDALGMELAVGTEPALRGRGLGRRLVVTAAQEVLRRGAVPTYLHAPDNTASAHVADSAGFPDLGWKVLGLWRSRP